jgi:membrane fusion protein (multidrug efflux system)
VFVNKEGASTMAQTNPARTFKRATLISTLFGLSALAAGPQDSLAPSAAKIDTQPGVTAPSEKRAQNFDLPGVVHKLFVKEGDTVKEGDPLAEQNLVADEAHLKSLKLGIESAKLEIEAEQATLEKDSKDLERKTTLLATKSISIGEFDDIKLQVKIDTDKVAHAESDEKKAEADVLEQEARIKQKRLLSTIDGIISEISTHEGELTNTDAQHPTVTIVKNDPLYVEVDLPAEVVRLLKAPTWNRPLQVQYVDEGDKGAWRDAKIRFIKPEADPKSNTEHVQLEMPNTDKRSSGLQVLVRVPTVGMQQVGAASPNQ